jgi:hypothetical protein
MIEAVLSSSKAVVSFGHGFRSWNAEIPSEMLMRRAATNQNFHHAGGGLLEFVLMVSLSPND